MTLLIGNRQRKVEGACFSLVSPTPVDNPAVVAVSEEALSLIDVESPLAAYEGGEFAEYFSGNKLLPGSQTAAHCYCGHQFGHFSGQLGDGCAMYVFVDVSMSRYLCMSRYVCISRYECMYE